MFFKGGIVNKLIKEENTVSGTDVISFALK